MGHSETLELRELAIPCCLTGRDLFVVLIFRAGTVLVLVVLDSRDAGTDRKLNLSVHNLALGYFVKPFDKTLISLDRFAPQILSVLNAP